MSDQFIPPWQDMATLCRNLQVPERVAVAWASVGIIPKPRDIDGLKLWNTKAIQAALMGNVYFIESGDLIKIGFSISPKHRLASLRGGSSQSIRVLLITHGTKKYERHLHTKFWRFRHHGEWFEKSAELMDYIENLGKLLVPEMDGP